MASIGLRSAKYNQIDYTTKKYKTLTSRQFFNFEVGDIVLVYSSWPIQRIVALCIVTQINLSSCDLYEEFWYSKTESIRFFLSLRASS